MAEFSIAYAPLKEFEGGWCNDAGDAGGETYAGIARNFFPGWEGWQIVDRAKTDPSWLQGQYAFSKHLSSIPVLTDMVADWYRAAWWDAMKLAQFPQVVANELFEQAVNLGRAGSGRYVQRLCNALNYNRDTRDRMFPDLAEDGVLGPKSLSALSLVLKCRCTPKEMVHALNGLQTTHYIGLGAKNFRHRKFVSGWLRRTYDPV